MNSRLRPRRDRLHGLGANILICLFVIGYPLVLLAINVTPWRESSSDLWTLLTSPDDGTLAMLVLAVAAWFVWLLGTVLFGIEIVALVRGVAAPHLPGLGLPQTLAGNLVAVAALLFVVAPTVAPAFAPQPAHAAEPPQRIAISQAASPTEAPAAEVLAVTTDPDDAAAPVGYTVRRGDSLWKIAKEQLGDGMRFREIVALNADVLQGRPSFIDPGLMLRLPSDAATVDAETTEPQTEETYIVESGDTLWGIADEKLGEGERYLEIFDASRQTVQADGQRLTDPNLIQPGWELSIPAVTTDTPATGGPTPDVEPGESEPQPELEPEIIEPGETNPTEGETPSAGSSQADEGDERGQDEESSSTWLLPGLTGAGTALAGVLFLAVRGYRRTQLRYRRPGQVLPAPPPELVGVEKSARLAGSPAVAQIEDLDRLLRHLAAGLATSSQPVPDLVAVELAEDMATLHLATPMALPQGWEGSETAWSFRLDSRVPGTEEAAPFPLLASVGQSVEGPLWLVNLERMGTICLTGAPDATGALGRHLAAELALIPWGILVEVDLLGIGHELADLDPLRLEHHDGQESGFVDRLADDLAKRAGHDPESFHALLTTPEERRSDQVRRMVQILTEHDARSGAVVIVAAGPPEPEDVIFELTTDGRLLIPSLGLDLNSAGLDSHEASTAAAITQLTRDVEPVAAPDHRDASEGWQTLADATGALHDDLVENRPAGPAGRTSLLPRDTDSYVAVAATTAEDVEQLAPVVPQQRREEVEQADPALDADLAAWFDPDCPLPRLSVLGPVRARTCGDATAVAKRRPHYLEMLTFLALHPTGAGTPQVAEAFGIKKERVRVDMGVVRKWLGTNPRTGQPHLPPATQPKADDDTGVWTYCVEDLLVDADLFRRLHARGQARGADGQADYDLALQLVAGPPYSELREKGWSWLLDGDVRTDEILACAIVDVAHVITTDALANDDVDRAYAAVEVARRASPYDEVARLDLVAVLTAQGHHDAAQRFLKDEICNRTDDQLPPIDLPERTAQVLRQREALRRPRTAG